MYARRLMVVTEQTVVLDRDFRNFFLRSPVPRLVVAVESDGRFTCSEINTAAADCFGISRDKVLGQALTDIFDISFAESFEQALQSCLRTRQGLYFDAVPKVAGGVRVQSFFLNPILDNAGNVAFVDVAEHADSGDKLHLQRERDDAITLLTSLFDASGLGIVVTDHHGYIVRVNEAFIKDYGWPREELLGEEFSLLIPEKEKSISRRLHQFFIEKGRHGTRELRIVKKDGQVADIVATTALLELSHRRRFMVSTIRDITERRNMMRNLKRAKEEADTANKAKSSFLANMSHELRTPLNAIIGFTELMKNKTFGPINNPKYEEYLSDIYVSACHLLEIINDVLDMSKIEAGRVQLVESEVSIDELFRTIQRIMLDRAQMASVSLVCHADKNVPNIKADQRLLRQVLINLVSNSIKFSTPGKPVSVSARVMQDGHVRLAVMDMGCGIPADKIRHVLEPFGQVNDPKHYKGQGTGLGLPLAKAMTELHDGSLTLQSEEGKGTTILIDLPVERNLPRERNKG